MISYYKYGMTVIIRDQKLYLVVKRNCNASMSPIYVQ